MTTTRSTGNTLILVADMSNVSMPRERPMLIVPERIKKVGRLALRKGNKGKARCCVSSFPTDAK